MDLGLTDDADGSILRFQLQLNQLEARNRIRIRQATKREAMMRENDMDSSEEEKDAAASAFAPLPSHSANLALPPGGDANAVNVAKVKLEKLDPKLVGMSVGFKNLYSGKEDKHGRFQWQEKIPEDVGKPAEDAETQKWALIVRYVKVYHDPRKTLGIHSIVVQSPPLKKLLEHVLQGYPGVTVGLQRLEFSGKFEPLIHRFPELKAAIEELKKATTLNGHSEADDKSEPSDQVKVETASSTDDVSIEATAEVADATNDQGDKTNDEHIAEKSDGRPTTDKIDEGPIIDDATKLEHAVLLHDVLVGEFQTLLDSSQDMKAKSVMTYDYIWTLFQPGTMVFCRQDGQERVFKLKSAKYGVDKDGNPVFWLTLNYVDYDGSKFGYKLMNVNIASFSGTRPIASLLALPLEYHDQQNELKERLLARGTKVEAFAGTHYRMYEGIGWRLNGYGEKEKHSVKGRIIIDALGWNRYNPNFATFVTPLNRKGDQAHPEAVRLRLFGGSSITRSYASISDPGYDDGCDDCSDAMPMDGHFGDDEDTSSRQPLTDDQKLICTPLLRGYALKEKQWLNLFVNSVHDITFNSRAFESLVLPENQKELILGFTATQQGYRNTYDDVIEGKGRGIIILLCGPPGVGKTLTAESVAEEMKVPLFIMSAGDLGIDSRHIEARLLNVLGMCTRWNAILLLDEAEIFLEERSLHELERNKIVSIFLRVLEYHEGIMFLTTNRVQTFDPAFQSRIHISIDYPELSIESRLTVWKNFLSRHDTLQAAARERAPKNPASAIKSVTETNGSTDEEMAKRHEACTQPHAITTRQLDQLCLMNMNGRQIKNVLKTAQLLASRKGESLKHSHIMTVLDVTQHLHNASKENERTRNSLFA